MYAESYDDASKVIENVKIVLHVHFLFQEIPSKYFV